MDLGPRNFDDYNETDVREELIAPFIRSLGYKTGGEHNVRRELTLTYDRISLGRRKERDPVLTGKADYICTAGGRIQWVIEAKPPRERLTSLAEEQAWTYANHPNVRAVYHCLTNGREFKVFQTSNGPSHAPVFECSYEELAERIDALRGLLDPVNLLRRFPLEEPDFGVPLGPGLRSIVRIAGGVQKTTETRPHIPALSELVSTITEGRVERVDSHIQAVITTQSALHSVNELNEKLGLNKLTLVSTAKSISNDPESPTEFVSASSFTFPAGTEVIDIQTWRKVRLPITLSGGVTVTAHVHLNGSTCVGHFNADIDISAPGTTIRVVQRGTVELYLS